MPFDLGFMAHSKRAEDPHPFIQVRKTAKYSHLASVKFFFLVEFILSSISSLDG